MAAILVPAVKI